MLKSLVITLVKRPLTTSYNKSSHLIRFWNPDCRIWNYRNAYGIKHHIREKYSCVQPGKLYLSGHSGNVHTLKGLACSIYVNTMYAYGEHSVQNSKLSALYFSAKKLLCSFWLLIFYWGNGENWQTLIKVKRFIF